MPLPTTYGTELEYENMALRVRLLEQPTKSATFTSSNATTGAVTLIAGGGILTSNALSLVAATEYVLTLTNSLISSVDMLFASIQNGSNTQSPGPAITTVTPGSGVGTVRILNTSQTNALNGTLLINFFLVKMESWPAP